MRIPSGKIDQLIFFVAVDSTDLKTRKTGLTSFTVYRSRNGGTATVYTTPTVAELSAANMPGVYCLTIDEDTTIASTSDSEEYCVHITQASMAPVTRTIELYRRDTTSGNTALVDSNGRVDVIKLAGTTCTARDIGASVLLSSGTGTGQLDFTSGVVKANATQWLGGTIPAVNVTGVPLVDLKYTLGTISPATAGSVRADSVTGAVASVTARVTANTDQLAGQTVTAAAGVTFPTSVASPTNITAGTITTVTNLTNAPTAGDFTATMKTSLNAATPAVTVSDKTGFSLTAAYDLAKTAAQASDIPTANISAIKTQTDKLTFTVANQIDANIQYVNDVQVNGVGSSGNPWGP